MTDTPNTSVDEDAWLDEVLLSLRLDATVTDNQAYLVKQFADAKVYIKAHIQEVVVAERERITHSKINSEIQNSEAFKIAFTFEQKKDIGKHFCVFSADKEHFAVAIDGQLVIARESTDTVRKDGE